MDLLRRSCTELHQSIIVVTHDPKAAAYADRVVFLRDGRVIQEIIQDQAASFSQHLRLVIEAMELLEQ